MLVGAVLPNSFSLALTCVSTVAYLLYLADAQEGWAILNADGYIFLEKMGHKTL